MARSYRSSSIYLAPTLIVGLGGTGVEILRLIKGRIRQSTSPMPDIVEYLAIDTEMFQNLPGEERILDREFAYLGDYHAQSVLDNLSEHPHVDDWWFNETDIVSGSVHKGARQRRFVGRLSLFARWNRFIGRLDPKLRRIQEIARKERDQRRGREVERNTPLVQVYIIGSLCGGTGSGIFLDVAFRIRKQLKQDADIVGVFLLPSCFEPTVQSKIQRDRIKGNAYAALRELNHFLDGTTFNSSWPEHPFQDSTDRKITHPIARPFDSVFLVDNHNGKNDQLSSLDQDRRLAAQQVFLDLVTPIGKRFAARRANLRDLASSHTKRGALAIAAFATASLVLPEGSVDVVAESAAARFIQQHVIGDDLDSAARRQLDSDTNELFGDFARRLRFEKIVPPVAPTAAELDPWALLAGTPATSSSAVDLSAGEETQRAMMHETVDHLLRVFSTHGLLGVSRVVQVLIECITAQRNGLESETTRLRADIKQRTQQKADAAKVRPVRPGLVKRTLFRSSMDDYRTDEDNWSKGQTELQQQIDELQQQTVRNGLAIEILTRFSLDIKAIQPELYRRQNELRDMATDLLATGAQQLMRETNRRSMNSRNGRAAAEFELETVVGFEHESLEPGTWPGPDPLIVQYLRDVARHAQIPPTEHNQLFTALLQLDIFRPVAKDGLNGPTLVLAPNPDLNGVRDTVAQAAARSTAAAMVERPLSVVHYLNWFYEHVPYNGATSRHSPIDPLEMLRHRCSSPFLGVDDVALGVAHAANTEPIKFVGVSPTRAEDKIVDSILDEFDGEAAWEEVNTGVSERLDLTYSLHGYEVSALEDLRTYRDIYRQFLIEHNEMLHIHHDWPRGMRDLVTPDDTRGDYVPPTRRRPSPVPSPQNDRNNGIPGREATATQGDNGRLDGERVQDIGFTKPGTPTEDHAWITSPPIPVSSPEQERGGSSGNGEVREGKIDPTNAVARGGGPSLQPPQEITPPPTPLISVSSPEQQWGALTDTGKVRDHNEDGYFAAILSPPGMTPVWGLYVVADGMGGHESGEVASSMALDIVRENVTAYYAETGAGTMPTDETLGTVLQEAVRQAHRAVHEENTIKGKDMGTTVVAALVVGERAVITHLGDSRAYIWNAGQLRQVTEDHSLVWRLWKAGRITKDEIYTHETRNRVLRSIGQGTPLEFDPPIIERLAPGARLLLCSDGQWEMTRDGTIAACLAQHADPQDACAALVLAANNAGGEDNITDVVVQVNT